MEAELLRDWPTLVWVERTAFRDVLERDEVDAFVADVSTELPNEVGDDTLSECAFDVCVLLIGVFEGYAPLNCEINGYIVDEIEEGMLCIRKLDELTPNDDTLESIILDDCVIRETRLDEAMLGDGTVVIDVVGEASLVGDPLEESTGSVDALEKKW